MRKGYVERRSATGSILEPDSAAMGFGDFLDDGQSDTTTATPVGRRTKALEHVEYAAMVIIRDAATPVTHGDVVMIVPIGDGDLDERIIARAHVIDRVSNQVREDLVAAAAVAVDQGWVVGEHEPDALLVEPGLELRREL